MGLFRFERLGGIFLWLVLFLCSPARTQTVHPDAEANYENGLKSTNLNDKIKFFEKAVELQPEYLDAVYQLGVTFFQKQQYEKTIQHLTHAIELNNGHYRESKLYLRNAHTFHATKLNESGQPESALAYALEAAKLDESFPPAHTVLGLIQFNLENWQAAIRAFHQSIKLNPNQEAVWARLGNIYFRLEDYPAAIFAYERALTLDPNLKEAQVHLNLSMKRATPAVWLSAIENLQNQGRHEEAAATLQRAITVYPDDPGLIQKMQRLTWEADYAAASAAMDSGKNRQALKILQTIDPNYKDVALKIAELQTIISVNSDSMVKAASPKQPAPSKRKSDSPQVEKNTDTKPNQIAHTTSLDSSLTNDVVKNDSLPSAAHDTTAIAEMVNAEPNLPAETSRVSSENKMPADQFGAVHWVAVALSSLLLFGLVVMKYGLPLWGVAAARLQTWRKTSFPRRSRPAHSDNTIEFFKDRVASVTPIKFEPIEVTQVVPRRKGRTKKMAPQKPQAPPLEDTQTILGGIKKIKRIGRYILEKEIGRGTMGLIYKAWDPKLDRTVVIKQVVFDAINSLHELATLKDRLFREARAAGRLNHPNIVIIYDVDEDKDFSYIVMEYLQGKDLKLLLEKEIRFDLPRTINIISQICSALDYAHQMGIVHRDIKPSNIILTQNQHVKVADFGIAKLPHFGTLTQTGSIIGTPYYMSPEQIEGRKLDGRSDLFSVGVILYEMLTGCHPFSGETIPSVVYKIVHQQPKPPSTIREDLPKPLDEIVSRALAKDPDQRYTTALDLIVDLESVQGELLKNEV